MPENEAIGRGIHIFLGKKSEVDVCSWANGSSGWFVDLSIPYRGKLSREKTFANFAVLWLFAKVFAVKFGGMVSLGVAKASNLPRKFPAIQLCYVAVCRLTIGLVI